MRAAGVREVLVTHGSEGAVIYGGSSPIAIAAIPPRRTVDATGCGDTYLAAYLARRITSDDLGECGVDCGENPSVDCDPPPPIFQPVDPVIHEPKEPL